MNRFRISLLTICVLTASLTSSAQLRQELAEEIDKIIFHETKIDLSTHPGYVVGVQLGDSTFVYSFGSIKKGEEIKPTESTIFEIGGMTKAITATLVMLMAKDGLVELDQSLNSCLPDSVRNPDLDHVTLAQILQHTSGLPRMPLEFGVQEQEENNPYAHYTRKQLFDFYKNYQPLHSHGQYLYSNLSFALLEVALEHLSGRPYKQLLKDYIFTPLEMKQSYIDTTGQDLSQMATGYSMSGQETAPWDFSSFAASEGIKSTVADLLKFTGAVMDQNSPVASVLPAMVAPRLPTKITKYSFVGLGWHLINNRKYYDAILHPGSTSGYRSFLGFVPETRTAVVVLTNSEYGTDSLGFLILRLINHNWKKKKQK